MYTFKMISTPEKDETLTVQTAALSVRGRGKPVNEDFAFHRMNQLPSGHSIALMLVCDGLGGYQVGSFASELAAHVITTEIGKLFPRMDYRNARLEQPTIPRTDKLQAWLIETIQEANHLIYQYASEQPEIKKSGTRLTLALIHCKTAYIAHVGDTRAYLWRNLDLTQITEDHSFVAELERNGVLDSTAVLHHPLRKILSKSVGTQPKVKPETYTISLWPGDKLMLCSDGIWSTFDDFQSMADILDNNLPSSDLCAMFIDEARARDDKDDMSVALACVNSLS
jgi:PPM family protein phosphatase